VKGCERHILGIVGRECTKNDAGSTVQIVTKKGNDLAVVDGELAKLLLYVGGGETVTPQDVDLIVVDSRAGDFFEVINLFL
jgi:DNA polymerase III delta subunit